LILEPQAILDPQKNKWDLNRGVAKAIKGDARTVSLLGHCRTAKKGDARIEAKKDFSSLLFGARRYGTR